MPKPEPGAPSKNVFGVLWTMNAFCRRRSPFTLSPSVRPSASSRPAFRFFCRYPFPSDRPGIAPPFHAFYRYPCRSVRSNSPLSLRLVAVGFIPFTPYLFYRLFLPFCRYPFRSVHAAPRLPLLPPFAAIQPWEWSTD